jgi:hypothetical protein
MTNSEDDVIIQKTLHWVRAFVIEYNICPFAKQALDKAGLTVDISQAQDKAAALEALMTAIWRLDNDEKIETSLLIFPSLFNDFFTYLDFVDLAEQLMFEQNYEGVYQLATFHPQYCFADVDFDDVSNYTNRSPYSMLHLLRESSIDKAIEYYGDTEQIPEKNIETMRKLGLEKIHKIIM